VRPYSSAMATARPLRDVFTEITGDDAARTADPTELLRSSGHGDLSHELVAEAVTSYADTAPVEVAEHLSPYVMANSAVPGVGTEVDPSSWLEVLASAPAAVLEWLDPTSAGLDEAPTEPTPAPAPPDGDDADVDDLDGFDLAFGRGGATGDESFGEALPVNGSAVSPPDAPGDVSGVDLDELTAPTFPGAADVAPTETLGEADADDDGESDGAGG
jgi:hypothetical protein